MSRIAEAATRLAQAMDTDDKEKGIAALVDLAAAVVEPFERIAAALERMADKP